MFPFSNSAGNPASIENPSSTPTPTPEPLTGRRDVFSDPGFTVPYTTTVSVSGGDQALNNAVAVAGPGTRILVSDSATYAAVVIASKTNLTIEAAAGQTPRIEVPAGVGQPLIITGVTDGVRIAGIHFEGTGNRNPGSFSASGLIRCRFNDTPSLNHVIIEDCTFREGPTDPANGSLAILILGTDGTLHRNVVIRRCTVLNSGSGAWTLAEGAAPIMMGGLDGVWIQNCKVSREPAVVSDLASNMKAYGWRAMNVIVENCLADNVSDAWAPFYITDAAQWGTAVGVALVRNCVAFNCTAFAWNDEAAATMIIRNCVFDTPTTGIATPGSDTLFNVGIMTAQDSIFADAGEADMWSAGTVPTSEDHNDIFAHGTVNPPASITDFALDPQFVNEALRDFVTQNPTLQVGASDGGAIGVRYPGGERIIWILT